MLQGVEEIFEIIDRAAMSNDAQAEQRRTAGKIVVIGRDLADPETA